MEREKAEKRFFISLIWVLLFLTFLPASGYAAIPQKINYQGYLTNAAGVPVNGSVQMVFAIYDALSSGTKLWEETHNVNVTSGVYNVILGEGTPPTPINLLFDIPYYLSVRVGADPDMAQRVPLTSVGYAFRAQNAESGGGWTHTTGVISLGTGTDKVGIGTTTPSEELHVKGSGYLQGVFESTNSSGGIQLASSNGEKYELQTVNDGSFILYDRKDGRYVMNVDTNGNVGFGTNTPTGKLQGEISSNLVGHSIYGVYGKASGNMGSNYGVFGESSSIFAGSNYGVYGKSSGNVSGGTGYAVYGENTGDGYGGYFIGDGYFSGAVGIGQTNPSELLELSSPSSAFIVLDRGVDQLGGITHREAGTTRWIFPFFRGWQSDNLIVRDEPTGIDVMTFQAGTGRVGVGTLDPQSTLHVEGDIRAKSLYGDYIGLGGDDTSNDIEIVIYAPAERNHVSFWNASLGTGANIGAGEASFSALHITSDERMKKNVTTIDGALVKVASLRGVEFEWRKDKPLDKGRKMGLIAQEVEKVLPEVVSSDRNNGYKSVEYANLVALLIEAIKELRTENEGLRARIEALEIDSVILNKGPNKLISETPILDSPWRKTERR